MGGSSTCAGGYACHRTAAGRRTATIRFTTVAESEAPVEDAPEHPDRTTASPRKRTSAERRPLCCQQGVLERAGAGAASTAFAGGAGGRRVGCRVQGSDLPEEPVFRMRAGHAGDRDVPGCPARARCVSVVVADATSVDDEVTKDDVGEPALQHGSASLGSCPRRPCGRRTGGPVCRNGAG